MKSHADGYTIAPAIRFAIVRMPFHSLDPKLISDADLQDSFVQQLVAIGLAMKTTRGWMRQPSVAERMTHHISALRSLVESVS